jgi:hypothetical protein
MSHRTGLAAPATARWLANVGIPFDDLTCCDDKIACCVEDEVELLIDDSPINLQAAIDNGIRVATLLHPWNRDFCEEEAVICAHDWPALSARLIPMLEGQRIRRGPTRTGSSPGRRPDGPDRAAAPPG